MSSASALLVAGWAAYRTRTSRRRWSSAGRSTGADATRTRRAHFAVPAALSDEAFVAPATAREIAADLVVTEAAVKQHLLRLYQKFRIPEGPNRRTRLANEVVRLGLVRPLPPAERGGKAEPSRPGAGPSGRRARDKHPGARAERAGTRIAGTGPPGTGRTRNSATGAGDGATRAGDGVAGHRHAASHRGARRGTAARAPHRADRIGRTASGGTDHRAARHHRAAEGPADRGHKPKSACRDARTQRAARGRTDPQRRPNRRVRRRRQTRAARGVRPRPRPRASERRRPGGRAKQSSTEA